MYPTVKGLGKITSKCRDSDSRDFSRMIKEWVTIRSLFICFFFLSAIFFPFDFYRIGRLRASLSLLVYWSPCNTKLTTCSMPLCMGYVKNRFVSGQGERISFFTSTCFHWSNSSYFPQQNVKRDADWNSEWRAYLSWLLFKVYLSPIGVEGVRESVEGKDQVETGGDKCLK